MPYGGVTLLMALIWWIAAGTVVGLIFGAIMGTGERGGFLAYLLFGIAGAIFTGFLYRLLGNIYTSSWQVDLMTGTIGALFFVVTAEYSHRRVAPKRGGRSMR